ncbi:MAG TPA: MFS transporter [Xanthobacteraceae bacterium]|jgi:MFS family permease|nr:MFS transporter [Xanthobacteraceae bacterium]
MAAGVDSASINDTARQSGGLPGWRTPLVIVLCGCLIGMLTFGPRSATGQFLTPLSFAHGWGREVFSLALAMQNLLWGIGQPLAGGIADRYGSMRVLCVGALLYGVGLVMMAHVQTPTGLELSAGFLVGFGLAGCSFNIIIGAFGKLVPESWRTLSFGAGTAAGSFGQFLFSPLARGLIDTIGWQNALTSFGFLMLLVLPLSIAVATRPTTATAAAASGPQQSYREALSEALRHRSYVLLVLGFFTCGFQLQFVTVHLPSYLMDRGLSAEVGGWTIGVIGLFNIVGSLCSGWLGSFLPKRYILAAIYLLRGAAIMAFIMLPMTVTNALVFGATMGFLWLSTVPPTNGIVAVMFGTRWLTMLSGFAFFSHQVGGFLGVLLGGIAFERTGSYNVIWWLSIAFSVLSAVINLPIVERPVARPQAVAA